MINPRSERPVYRQMADDLRESIKSGQVMPDGWLPSSVRLQQTYGVSRETVRRALAVLRQEGLVVTEPGYGTRVRVPVPRETVRVPRGAQWIARAPTEQERADLDLEDGEPVAVLTLGGRVRGVYAGDRTLFTFS